MSCRILTQSSSFKELENASASQRRLPKDTPKVTQVQGKVVIQSKPIVIEERYIKTGPTGFSAEEIQKLMNEHSNRVYIRENLSSQINQNIINDFSSRKGQKVEISDMADIIGSSQNQIGFEIKTYEVMNEENAEIEKILARLNQKGLKVQRDQNADQFTTKNKVLFQRTNSLKEEEEDTLKQLNKLIADAKAGNGQGKIQIGGGAKVQVQQVGGVKTGQNGKVEVNKFQNVEEIQKFFQEKSEEQRKIHQETLNFQMGLHNDIKLLTEQYNSELTEEENKRLAAFLAKQNELTTKQNVAENNLNVKLVTLQLNGEKDQNALKVKQQILQKLKEEGATISQEAIDEEEIRKMFEEIQQKKPDAKKQEDIFKNLKVRIQKTDQTVNQDQVLVNDILKTAFGGKLVIQQMQPTVIERHVIIEEQPVIRMPIQTVTVKSVEVRDKRELRNDKIAFDFLDSDFHTDRYYPQGTGHTTHYRTTFKKLPNEHYVVANLEMDQTEFEFFLGRRKLKLASVLESNSNEIKWSQDSLPPQPGETEEYERCNQEIEYNGIKMSRSQFEYEAWEHIEFDFSLIGGVATSRSLQVVMVGDSQMIDTNGKPHSTSFSIKMVGIKVDLTRTINGQTTHTTENIEDFLENLKTKYTEITLSDDMKKLIKRYQHTGKYLNYLQTEQKTQVVHLEEEVLYNEVAYETVTHKVEVNERKGDLINDSLSYDFYDPDIQTTRYMNIGTGYSSSYRADVSFSNNLYKVANLQMDEAEYKLFLCRRGLTFDNKKKGKKDQIKWTENNSIPKSKQQIKAFDDCNGQVPSLIEKGKVITRQQLEYEAFGNLLSEYKLTSGGNVAASTAQGIFTAISESSSTVNKKTTTIKREVKVQVKDCEIDIQDKVNDNISNNKEYIDVFLANLDNGKYPSKLKSQALLDLLEKFKHTGKYLNYLAKKSGH